MVQQHQGYHLSVRCYSTEGSRRISQEVVLRPGEIPGVVIYPVWPPFHVSACVSLVMLRMPVRMLCLCGHAELLQVTTPNNVRTNSDNARRSAEGSPGTRECGAIRVLTIQRLDTCCSDNRRAQWSQIHPAASGVTCHVYLPPETLCAGGSRIFWARIQVP